MNNEDKSNAEDFTIHPHHDEEETKAWINEPHLLIEIFIGTGKEKDASTASAYGNELLNAIRRNRGCVDWLNDLHLLEIQPKTRTRLISFRFTSPLIRTCLTREMKHTCKAEITGSLKDAARDKYPEHIQIVEGFNHD
jgi:hypothetical protein